MKKFFSVFMIAVCCMAWAMPAQAQVIKFGVKGGVNLSKLKFEGMKDNSTGVFFGPMAEITIPVIGLGVDGALLYSCLLYTSVGITGMKIRFLWLEVQPRQTLFPEFLFQEQVPTSNLLRCV